MKKAPWTAPSETNGVNKGLMINNTLTDEQRVPFVPHSGNRVNWYICGPTVYDASHLGHARNYMSFDVIRRILQDYFHYEVFSVMNITDVDDKIILKARREFLFNEFAAAHPELTLEVKDKVRAAWELAKASTLKKLDGLAKDTDRSEQERVGETKLMQEKLGKIEAFLKDRVDSAPLDESRENLGILLDGEKGSSIQNLDVSPISSRYEREYMEDMEALGILPPDALTRVSEFVDPIITFIERVIDNGFAYESNGSVYFDTVAYIESDSHDYGKLAPEKIGNVRLLQEGEGSLAAERTEKRHPNDFVLWKNSKPGEPVWKSPWGQGRPGWHIECSAMAAELLGEVLDVHGGGQDLKFPHHENEIAQCEAFFHAPGQKKQWVNYFMHSGHLHIEGLKMSKSLKNFITIREALASFTARQLRLFFVTRSWDAEMNYERSAMEEVKSQEKNFVSFFAHASHLMRAQSAELHKLDQRWDTDDVALHDKLLAVQLQVDAAFKDNFDTRSVIFALLDVVSACQVYFNREGATPKSLLIKKIADYVKRILGVQGLVGFDGQEGEGVERLNGVLDALAQFRRDVRAAAKSGDIKAGEVLAMTDVLRDATLPVLGVKLDDDTDVLWHNIDAEGWVLEQRQLKEAALRQIEKKLDLRRLDLQRAVDAAKSPEEVIDKSQHSSFRESDGAPLTDATGEPLPKGTIKNFAKLIKKQATNHKKHLAKLQKDPEYVSKLEQAVAVLQEEHRMLKQEIESE